MRFFNSLFFTVALFFCATGFVKAQYEAGQIDINAGIGLVPTFGVGDVSILTIPEYG
jgi:hypothetical protein